MTSLEPTQMEQSCMHHEPEPPGEKVPRRKLLGWLVGVINLGVFAAIFTPTLRFIADPMRRKKGSDAWIPVIGDGEIAEGETRSVDYRVNVDDGYMVSPLRYSVFLHRSGGEVFAFSPTCPHLGCNVKFHSQNDRYICPCHGGVFSSDGGRISGPPPHGLTKLPAKVENGQIWIQRV